MSFDTDRLVTRYIAVWNETDAQRRRERVAELWGDGGQSLQRVLDPRGVDAITARVAASHDKWIAGRGFEFRLSGVPQAHHDAVLCNWAMGPRGSDEVVSLGLSFLLLDADGRLHSDLQFVEPPSPPTREQTALVERYVAVWNDNDGMRRLDRVATLWSERGAHVNPQQVHMGTAEITAEAARVYAMCGAQGQRFRCAGRVEGHHGAVRMDWELLDRDGTSVLAAGTNLLLLEADGRLQRDVQFDAPAQRMA
jgi:hypothetical protein